MKASLQTLKETATALAVSAPSD